MGDPTKNDCHRFAEYLSSHFRRTIVIANPSAGRGRAARRLARYTCRLPNDVEVSLTTTAGEAYSLSKRAADEGADLIIAAGGDGTIHDVINGILDSDREEVSVGIFPLGSANDLVNGLAYTGEARRDEETRIAEVTIDIGKVMTERRHRFFCNSMGVFFPAAVAIRAQSIRGIGRSVRYPIAVLGSIICDVRYPMVTWQIDDNKYEDDPTLVLCVGLGPRDGSFLTARNAKWTDGKFEILHVGKLNRLQLLRYFPGLLLGKIPTNHPRIKAIQSSELTVQSEHHPINMHLDGEIFIRCEDNCSSFHLVTQAAKTKLLIF